MPEHKTYEKKQAQQLYLRTAYTQKAIAKAVGISENTMTAWVTEGKWADLKKQTYNSPEQEVQQLYEELRIITRKIKKRDPDEQIATKEELDARTKLSALIQGHLKNTTDNWRNVPLDIDLETIEKQEAQAANPPVVEKIYVEEKFTTERLRDYYNKVANLLVKADASIGKISDKDEDWK